MQTVNTEPDSIFKGALLTLSMRWLSRLIGIASTLVLARLLMPDDFGVVAMASIVVGLSSMLLDLGVNVALIRNTQATSEHYHSAWTLRLLQALVVAALLVAVSPVAADYFSDSRVSPVLVLMAVNVVISGLENIGIVAFQKEMQFGREFRYLLINRIFGLVCTIGLAFALRSYWALVIATTCTVVFGVVHSYLAHPLRPRWCTAKLRELFSVSQWMLVQNIGGYLDNNLHKLLVGRRDDTATMGAYSVAADVAAMPSTELLQPVNRVLFPAFVAVKHDLDELKRTFLLALGLQTMIALPAAAFMAILADVLVPVLLGDRWVPAVPLLQVLALSSACQAIQSSAWYVSITLGREKLCASVAWLQVAAFLFMVSAVVPWGQAPEIAIARVEVAAAGLLLQFWIVKRALGNLRLGELIAATWRTFVGLVLVVLVVRFLPTPDSWPAITLFIKAAVCLVVQAAVQAALWIAAGRPDGAERYVMQKLQSLIARRRGVNDTP